MYVPPFEDVCYHHLKMYIHIANGDFPMSFIIFGSVPDLTNLQAHLHNASLNHWNSQVETKHNFDVYKVGPYQVVNWVLNPINLVKL